MESKSKMQIKCAPKHTGLKLVVHTEGAGQSATATPTRARGTMVEVPAEPRVENRDCIKYSYRAAKLCANHPRKKQVDAPGDDTLTVTFFTCSMLY